MAFGTIAILGINITLNLIFIPMFGIVGASLASLISYTCQAGMVIVLASHVSGQPALSLFVPGAEEVRLVIETARRVVRRVPLRSGSETTPKR
jgi:Na+-driven multidrug efflux pump